MAWGPCRRSAPGRWVHVEWITPGGGGSVAGRNSPGRRALSLEEPKGAPAMTPPPATVEKLVRASFAAWVAKDRSAIEALLADDFHFSSPLDNRLDRTAYFELCWPGSERIHGVDILRLTVDRDH